MSAKNINDCIECHKRQEVGEVGMSYQSPIDVIMGEMKIQRENEICKAVQNVGVTVDRNELLRALQYDRGQYQKGYIDRDSEIIRCMDCRFKECTDMYGFIVCDITGEHHKAEWFCADGRSEENA